MTTFLFARIFVASSLSKIQELVQYVKDLDIHKLTMPVPLSGPEDDEIRIMQVMSLRHLLQLFVD